MKKIRITSLVIMFVLLFTACNNNNDNIKSGKVDDFKSKINFSGSSTLAPVVALISENYINQYKTWDKVNGDYKKDKISIFVSPGGSGQGVKAVIDKSSDFGMLARNIKDSEKSQIEDLKEYKVGIDALTIAVNKENPLHNFVKNLSKAELVKIFSGEYKNYSDIDESLPSKEIVIITRDSGGGAYEVFQKKVMGEVQVKNDAIQASSMGALVNKLISNKYAIGYASYGMVKQNTENINTFSIDGVEPTTENIINESYMLQRPLIIIHSGELTSSENEFLNYILSDKGLEIIEKMGFIKCK